MKKRETNLKFLIRLAGVEKYKLYIAAILSSISSLLALFPYILMYLIITELLERNIDVLFVKTLVMWTIIAIVVQMIFFIAAYLFSHISAFSILYQLRIKAVEKMSQLNMGFFTSNSSGKLKKIINEDIEKIELFIAHQIPDLVAALSTPLIIFTFLFFIEWRLALLLLIPIVMGVVAQSLVMRGYVKRADHFHNLSEKLNSTVMQYVRGMPVFKAFNLSAGLFKKYQDVSQEYTEYWGEISKNISPPHSVFIVITDSALLFIIPAGGYLLLTKSITISTYLLFLILSMNFLNSFKTLFELSNKFSYLLKGVGKIREVIEEKSQEDGVLEFKSPLQKGIEFKNVDFGYSEKLFFQNLDIAIKLNTTVALVGASGAGKTTVAQLLGRFWDIDSGEILIDGKNIKEIKYSNLMDNISFVFQDTFMMHDTIYENIRVGMNKKRTQIISAAKKAEIHDFIMSLPNGYETLIGEKGVKISGGEKQRIAIARTILKDSPIVVLDEATSSSDVESEGKIQKALRNLLKDKTGIIIAHRLYTIIDVDEILVFDEGKIIEKGTHRELVKAGGLYKNLWDKSERGKEGIKNA